MVQVILAVSLRISRNIRSTIRQSAVLFQLCDLNKPKKFIENAAHTSDLKQSLKYAQLHLAATKSQLLCHAK